MTAAVDVVEGVVGVVEVLVDERRRSRGLEVQHPRNARHIGRVSLRQSTMGRNVAAVLRLRSSLLVCRALSVSLSAFRISIELRSICPGGALYVVARTR